MVLLLCDYKHSRLLRIYLSGENAKRLAGCSKMGELIDQMFSEKYNINSSDCVWIFTNKALLKDETVFD